MASAQDDAVADAITREIHLQVYEWMTDALASDPDNTAANIENLIIGVVAALTNFAHVNQPNSDALNWATTLATAGIEFWRQADQRGTLQ